MKLSIIIPVYNVEKMINNLLQVLVKQLSPEVELILVNDGSTDKSLSICNFFSQNSQYIKVISQENSGVSRARNTGLDNSSGDYVVFIDSDDLVSDDYVSSVLTLCDLQKDIIQMDWLFGNLEKGYRLGTVGFEEGDIDLKSYVKCLLQQRSNTPWNKIYKSQIIKENAIRFDNKITVGEDIKFTIDYMKYAKSIFISKKNVYKYFIRTSGLRGSVKPNYFFDNYVVYESMIDLVNTNNDYQELIIDIENSMLAMAFRTIGHCIYRGYSAREINKALIESKIYDVIKNAKCKNFKDFLRMMLIKTQAYFVISILVKK